MVMKIKEYRGTGEFRCRKCLKNEPLIFFRLDVFTRFHSKWTYAKSLNAIQKMGNFQFYPILSDTLF